MCTINKILLVFLVLLTALSSQLAAQVGNMSLEDYRVMKQMNIGSNQAAMKRTNSAYWLEIGDSARVKNASLLWGLAKYKYNFGSIFDARTLVDKGYVDSLIAAEIATAGTPNENVGSGYRWLKPATQQLKTFFPGWATLLDSTTNSDALTIHLDSSVTDPRYIRNLQECGLICGTCGIVTWSGTGMVFNASPASYVLSGVAYFFPGGDVTLSNGDATFDRFDAIVLTASGIDVIEGDPSADPQLPQFDPCENVLLTYVFVQANATTPTQVTDELIFDENAAPAAEWAESTTGSITADFDNTTFALHGTKALRIDAWNNGANVIWTDNTSNAPYNYNTFSFWIRLTGGLSSTQNISVQFYNNTTQVSTQVVATFVKSFTTSFQLVTISMSQFVFTSTTFNNVHFIFSGNVTADVYIDWVRFQSGVSQPSPPSGGVTNAYTRMTDGTNTSTSVGGDIFKYRADVTMSATVANNDATHGDYVIHKVDTSLISTKWYAGSLVGGTPTLQQVMTAGTNITSSHTILLNTFQLGIGGAISGGASVAIFNNASSGPALTASAVSDASSPAFSAQNTGDGDAMFVVKNGTETSTTASVGSFFANGGTVANGFGGHLNYYAETSVQARIAGKFKWWWSDKTDATRTSQIDLWGVNSATDERYMNIQADGTVRVNNDADTLAKLSDVRSMEVGGSTPSLNKAITLYFPSSSENTTMWTVPVDITITSVVAVNVGSSSPSVTFQVAFGTDRTSGTNVFSSGRTVTSTTTVHTFNSSFNDATIPAGSIIWITTSAQSGTVNETNITINYTED